MKEKKLYVLFYVNKQPGVSKATPNSDGTWSFKEEEIIMYKWPHQFSFNKKELEEIAEYLGPDFVVEEYSKEK